MRRIRAIDIGQRGRSWSNFASCTEICDQPGMVDKRALTLQAESPVVMAKPALC
jgi:hypothetical protein